MDPKAESIVKNIGAIAESTSVFYNAIVRQVPKDVALVLTQHFMDITMNRRAVAVTPEQLAKAAALAEARRRSALQNQEKTMETPEKAEEKPEEKPEESADSTENPERN